MGTSTDDHWAALWDRHADAVYAFARRRVGPNDAPDVVAEVFAAAMSHPERVPDDALPWLLRTAWNVVSNHWRAEARHQRPGPQVARATSDPADVVTERDRFLAALGRISEVDREALILTAWDGLDPTAAAAVTGCTPGTFSVRLHRARTRFETALGELDRDQADEEELSQ